MESRRARLKNLTSDWHTALESSWPFWELSKPNFSCLEYANVLKALYGFILPIELKLSSCEFQSSFFSNRFKTKLLEADLAALNVNLAALPLCTELPNFGSDESVVGVWYVLEGSSIGGKLILKRINAMGENWPRSYYSYDISAWQSFLELLEDRERVKDFDLLASAALATFRCLVDWSKSISEQRRVQNG